ncbi:MAG: hypothetical protein P8R42_02600 [Candidatus Binatia bacterium]|nr:hypothetical protein [Candidatus Binatia bacterium]
MTIEATRRLLWIALLVALPVPYWAMEGGWVPTIWLYELSGFTLAVLLTEGGSIIGLTTGLFVAEALLATLGLYLLARVAARLLVGRLPEAWRTGGVLATVVVLLGLSLLRVYATPLVASGDRINLLQLFA